MFREMIVYFGINKGLGALGSAPSLKLPPSAYGRQDGAAMQRKFAASISRLTVSPILIH